MSLFRPAVDALHAYAPGEQPARGTGIVKLNTNENPYPPSPAAMAALREIDDDQLRRYPHPHADEFRLAVADVLGLDIARIVVGNGSDDILTMLMRAVSDKERAVAYPVPTYVLYRTLAEIQDAQVHEIPYGESFALPIEALAATRAALTLVANPNSPSGTLTPIEALSGLAGRVTGVLVIDEAYTEFATENALELTTRFDHVMVLRTLSKSHSLAGLRLGFGIGSPNLVTGLTKVKDSYNVDAVACQVGAAALRDTRYTAEIVGRVCATRGRLVALFAGLGFAVWPSAANFLLVRPPRGDAGTLYRYLKTVGILCRYFDTPGLSDKLRVTVGTESDTDRLEEALRSFCQEGQGDRQA